MSHPLRCLLVFYYVLLQKDPAIERWAKMRETTHLHFQMRPKTIFYGLIWGVLVPGAFYYALKRDLVIMTNFF